MIICVLEAFRSAVLQLAFRTRRLIECVEYTHTHTISLIPANLVSHQYVWSVQVSAIDSSSSYRSMWFRVILDLSSHSSCPCFSFPLIFCSLLVFLSSHPVLSSDPLRFSINMLLASSYEVLNIHRMFLTSCTCLCFWSVYSGSCWAKQQYPCCSLLLFKSLTLLTIYVRHLTQLVLQTHVIPLWIPYKL